MFGWVVLLLLAVPAMAEAQVLKLEPEPGWRPLLEHEGVVFRYIFYREADSVNDGLVLRLTNTNQHAVRYRFRIVFRSDEREHEELVTGRLAPREDITGDLEGLFWVPFPDGASITEVGLRGYHIAPVQGGK
jgi:hypothetical protein